MTRLGTRSAVVVSLLHAVVAHAQTPPPAKPATAVAVAPVQPKSPFAATGDGYNYEPDGRRDPFLSLLRAGSESRTTKREDGVSGIAVGEISVRGIMMSQGAMVAMIQAPDKKTYIVHKGDKLLDGTIKSINTQGLIVDQQVTDPLSIAKHREVSKLLRSFEGGKE